MKIENEKCSNFRERKSLFYRVGVQSFISTEARSWKQGLEAKIMLQMMPVYHPWHMYGYYHFGSLIEKVV